MSRLLSIELGFEHHRQIQTVEMFVDIPDGRPLADALAEALHEAGSRLLQGPQPMESDE